MKLACQKSLTDLGLDYLDLYLIHFPISQRYVPIETRYPPEWVYDPTAENPKIELAPVPRHQTWAGMEGLVTDGLVKNIGVANLVVGFCPAVLLLCVLAYPKSLDNIGSKFDGLVKLRYHQASGKPSGDACLLVSR